MAKQAATQATWRTGAVVAVALAFAASANAAAVVAGIDFSFKYMKAVVVQPGSPFTIVTNPQSQRKTSANIGFYRGERLFGYDADGIATRKPQFTFNGDHTLLGALATSERTSAFHTLQYTAHGVDTGNRSEPVLVLPDHPDALPSVGEVRMLPEAYAAQLLSYMKRVIETQAGSPLSGAVITVPSFWSNTERAALLQAARLARIKVLRVVDENVAAGAQFGIDRVYPNDTNVLIYNMGATGTQATLFRFGSFKGRDGKMHGTSVVIGKGWDETLGGDSLDRVLVEHSADVFNAKHGDVVRKDVRTMPRAMAKLRKAVSKVKQVLSANAEFPLSVESMVHVEGKGDIDFRTTVHREDLLRLAKHLIARVPGPALQACRAAGVDPLDVEIVEIIGGGVRVPAVQEALATAMRRAERPVTPDPTANTAEGQEAIPVPALGVHLNGDEAVAFGAAFIAANISKSFRVRLVGLQDTIPFNVTARIFAAGAAADAEPLSTQLLSAYSRLGFSRPLKLPGDQDVEIELSYTPVDDEAVKPGLGPALGRYAVSGIEEAAGSAKATELGLEPNATARVFLSLDGTIAVVRGSASIRFVEMVPAATPTPKPNATKAKDAAKADAAADGADAEADAEADADADAGAEADAQADADAEANAEADATKAEEPAADADAADAATDDEDTPALVPHARMLRFNLKVEQLSHSAGAVPLTEEQLTEVQDFLDAMQRDDDERAARATSKNNMEGALMAARDFVDEASEAYTAVTSEEQREAIDEGLMALDEWLYGDAGEAADLSEMEGSIAKLAAFMDPVHFRIAEGTKRPSAVKKARAATDKILAAVATWAEAKPWIPEAEVEKVTAAVTEFTAWLDSSEAAQAELESHATPAFSSKDVSERQRALTRSFNAVSKTPKPTPSPAPSVKPAKKAKAEKATPEEAAEEAAAAAEEAAAAQAADAAAEAAEEGEPAAAQTDDEAATGAAEDAEAADAEAADAEAADSEATDADSSEGAVPSDEL